MALKKTNSRLNRFLDFIGLVDGEREKDQDLSTADPIQSRKGAGKRSADDDYDFDDTPRPRRHGADTGVKRSRPVSNFDDDFTDWDSVPSRKSTNRSERAVPEQKRSNGRPGSTAEAYARERAAGSGYGTAGASGRYRSTDSTYDSLGGEADTPNRNTYQRHQTVIYLLHSVDECKDVIQSLIEKKTVLLNLDDLDATQAQRALDIMSGASYAIGATISQASTRTHLITPSNVDVERPEADMGRYR